MKLYNVAVPGESSTITIVSTTVREARSYLTARGYRGDKAVFLNSEFFNPEEKTIHRIQKAVESDLDVAAFSPMVVEALHVLIKKQKRLEKQKEEYKNGSV